MVRDKGGPGPEVMLATSALDAERLTAYEPTPHLQSGGRTGLLIDRGHLHIEPAGLFAGVERHR